MSSSSLHPDHPVDALPEYVRGDAADTEAIEAHLAQCEACRVEVEVLRTLSASGPEGLSDVERQRVFQAVEARRKRPGHGVETALGSGMTGPGSGAIGPRWLRHTWRAAAVIALVLTGVGVWQIFENRPAPGWDPQLALDGWEQDLAELDVGPAAVRVAFGLDEVDEIPWEDLEGVDPYDFEAPWEDN